MRGWGQVSEVRPENPSTKKALDEWEEGGSVGERGVRSPIKRVLPGNFRINVAIETSTTVRRSTSPRSVFDGVRRKNILTYCDRISFVDYFMFLSTDWEREDLRHYGTQSGRKLVSCLGFHRGCH